MLFRGKPLLSLTDAGRDRWLYGTLIQENKRPQLVTEGGCWISVKPETVGQLTLCTDKYGQPIYEGDILLLSFLNENLAKRLLFAVEWIESGFYMVHGDNRIPLDPNNTAVFGVIVGNIHDTPDLAVFCREAPKKVHARKTPESDRAEFSTRDDPRR